MGDRISRLRKAKGWTKLDLRFECDIALSYIHKLETQPNIKPSAQTLHKLAEALETTIEYLLFGEESEAEAAAIRQFRALSFDEKQKVLTA